DEITGEIELFFSQLLQTKQDNLEDDEKIAVFTSALDFELSPVVASSLLNADTNTINDLKARTTVIMQEIMEQGVKSSGIANARRQLVQEINMLPFSPEFKQAMEKLLVPLVKANMHYNEEATLANKEAARESVEPVRILKNSLIVTEGEKVTEKHLMQLEALGLLGPSVHYSSYVGLFLILLTLFLIVILYLLFFARDVYNNFPHLVLLGLIVLVTLLLGIAARFFSAYIIPVAMGVILIAVLFNSHLAILINIILAVLVGILTGGDFSYFAVALVSGLVAIFSVSRVSRRNDLTRAGIFISLVNMVMIVAVFLYGEGFKLEYDFLKDFSIAVLAGLGNGLFSAVMAIGLLPYLESAFGLVTSITLLELSDPGRPLLRNLLMKAPGTYHHSIIVANLAEAAAEAIGANPLLTRVAAFYHDIGKVKRPYFFIENQLSGDNPHNRISPNLSALIIRSHVKDGVEMAKKEKLPPQVIDIVQQHHGTCMISFFYQQAQEQAGKSSLYEEDFRYEGPLPQTKEAAIIMLADSAEAAVRSLSKPVAGRIEGMVRRIIREKLNDGQFDEAPLTLKDLDQIGDTFAHILTGIYHTRIEYPESDLKAEIEKGGA
ncbi:MAG: HDIG domain-containing protein, partial [Firmicutes bacterium]|nr:HDIG domain-containing protein [Bacillota bacterium]